MNQEAPGRHRFGSSPLKVSGTFRGTNLRQLPAGRAAEGVTCVSHLLSDNNTKCRASGRHGQPSASSPHVRLLRFGPFDGAGERRSGWKINQIQPNWGHQGCVGRLQLLSEDEVMHARIFWRLFLKSPGGRRRAIILCTWQVPHFLSGLHMKPVRLSIFCGALHLAASQQVPAGGAGC